jgi:hypothetical protein
MLVWCTPAQPSSCCHLVFLIRPAPNDLERIVRQRPLQCFASSHGARIQTSRSSSVVRITGIAFGWIGATEWHWLDLIGV